MIKPNTFDRLEYLQHAQVFESNAINDGQIELDEFNNEIESIAIELAYARYRIAVLEREIEQLKGGE